MFRVDEPRKAIYVWRYRGDYIVVGARVMDKTPHSQAESI